MVRIAEVEHGFRLVLYLLELMELSTVIRGNRSYQGHLFLDKLDDLSIKFIGCPRAKFSD